MPRSFLLCGVSWDQSRLIFPPDKHDEIVAKVKAGLAESRRKMEEAGIDFELVHISPDEGMTRWIELITSKKWDGIIVGSAIRTTFPKLCEDLVNAIVQHSHASKILFNSTPADAFETAQRLFPDI